MILCIVIGGILAVVVLVVCVYKAATPRRRYNEITNVSFIAPEIPFGQTFHKVETLLAKPMGETSIFIDVPRLATKLIVKVEGKTVIEGPEILKRHDKEQYSIELTLKETVSELIRIFDGAELSRKFSEKFEETFKYITTKSEGDCAMFFKQLCYSVFTEDAMTLFVMKTFTQGLFASAVEYMMPLRTKHRYHDGYSGWNVQVEINGDHVSVIHKKGETSYKADAFDFEWCLTYGMSLSKKRITDMELKIINTQFRNYSNDLQLDFLAYVEKINREAHSEGLN
ncbi:hypothetical protein EIN_284030 [Entamoeba invadens IP1]|uniref:Ras guanine nucleotide exchange factor glfB-like C-terminal domain-containing protein n=1 Tax=Entamoeba invadens IP1 TaxID=370355 RepID=L7FKC0_ENTIV|nr:hypothetical protein EIN_284030 [Entamoeba invadens IP1]ELP84847.1 hypothetical protein EIN_284030 [Entamoeba invadens IP1]|eukprot:XP_004184193.1 hypothetical protein EIN_284030 [Entamoeba invadens IP1]